MAYYLEAYHAAGAQKGKSAGYYSGRAGQAWVDPAFAEAFKFAGYGEAERKALLFNGRAALHGLEFRVGGE